MRVCPSVKDFSEKIMIRVCDFTLVHDIPLQTVNLSQG